MWVVSWPVGEALWSATSSCATVPGSIHLRPLTPVSLPYANRRVAGGLADGTAMDSSSIRRFKMKMRKRCAK
jgi:hypothetical protein